MPKVNPSMFSVVLADEDLCHTGSVIYNEVAKKDTNECSWQRRMNSLVFVAKRML